MPVTDEHVASVRDYLTGTGANLERTLNLFRNPDIGPLYALTSARSATFAAERHDPRAKAIRFVGAMRAKPALAVRIDPRLAEQLIDLALGRTNDRPASPAEVHATRLYMLRAMVVDGLLEAAGFDDLLQSARRLADLRMS